MNDGTTDADRRNGGQTDALGREMPAGYFGAGISVTLT